MTHHFKKELELLSNPSHLRRNGKLSTVICIFPYLHSPHSLVTLSRCSISLSKLTAVQQASCVCVFLQRNFTLWVQYPQVPIMACKCDSFILFIHSQALDPWKTEKNEPGPAAYGKRQTTHRNPRNRDCDTGVCKWLRASHSSAYSCLFKWCSSRRPLPLPRARSAADSVYTQGLHTAVRATSGRCLCGHSPPVKDTLPVLKRSQGKLKRRIDEIQIPVFANSCIGT